MQTDFAATLKRLREKRGLSQSKLAEHAEFDHSYVSRLECGTRMPTREAVNRMADALGLGTAELDSLLTAAGFMPTRVTSLLDDQPECAALLRYLSNEAYPAEQRQAVRETVRGLLAAVGGFL